MEDLKLKYKSLCDAGARLNDALTHIDNIKKLDKNCIKNIDYEDFYLAARDSLIQRFEFTVELFWKYLKIYLELKLVKVESNTPSEVVRSACNAGLVSEFDAEQIIRMLKNRNFTSHIYKEELAELLSHQIFDSYQILKKNIDHLIPQS